MGQHVSRRVMVGGSAAALAASPAAAQSEPPQPAFAPQGRLTLYPGVAVTTADIENVLGIYYTPHLGRFVPIWDGSGFVMHEIGESDLSNDISNPAQGAGAAAGNSAYFLMIWDDGGTRRLHRSPAWANMTTPGIGAGSAEVEFLNGLWVNKYDVGNGPNARRGTIVGGFCTRDGAVLTHDSMQHRYLSNLYNQMPRVQRVVDLTPSWSYTTPSAWRVARGQYNIVGWFHALGGRMVHLDVLHHGAMDQVGIQALHTAIGIDSQFPAPECLFPFHVPAVAGRVNALTANYRGTPGMGQHFAFWLEAYFHGGAGGTSAWWGTQGGLIPLQSGMHGWTLN